nr:SH3 domain-containing protein [Deltaproteobacteria bacterium]
MRPSTLILVLILGVFSQEAYAEKVKSNQETKLFARPGERAKVILKVSEGKQMTVLAKEGRWLKVRVSGRTGYIARSTVDLPDEGEIARNTRRRSFVDGRGKTRGFGGEAGPDDRVGADAVGEGREDGGEEEEEEEEEEDPPAKTPPKAAVKAPPPKVATKTPAKKGGDDEEEEEEEENPVASKTPPKKAPAKGGDDEEEEEEEEDDRKRVKVSKKTTMFNEADPKSEAILVATKDTPLFPTGEKKGKFTEVENDEGDLGYILTADIEAGGKGGGEARDDLDDDDKRPSVGSRGGSQIDLRARAGVTLVSQGMRTSGGAETLPDNYNISTSAVTVALGGGYYRPMGKKLIVGGEGTYDYANAFGGIPTPPAMAGGAKTSTKISIHNLNVRAVLGLDFKKASGMMLLGRLGIRYHSFQVANASSMEKNTAKLPSEIITSPTIGAALAMPRLTKNIGLRFSLDFIPLNISYKQTKNLEDGKSP